MEVLVKTPDLEHPQAIEHILAERPALGRGPQVAIRRGDDTDVR
jgi:hypothetical protein